MKPPRPLIWITKNGTEFKPEEMPYEHLVNSILKIQRSIRTKKPWRREWLHILLREKARRIQLKLDDRHQRMKHRMELSPDFELGLLFEPRD
jgi:hypothetical protein